MPGCEKGDDRGGSTTNRLPSIIMMMSYGLLPHYSLQYVVSSRLIFDRLHPRRVGGEGYRYYHDPVVEHAQEWKGRRGGDDDHRVPCRLAIKGMYYD